jgi:hypothetical protein
MHTHTYACTHACTHARTHAHTHTLQTCAMHYQSRKIIFQYCRRSISIQPKGMCVYYKRVPGCKLLPKSTIPNVSPHRIHEAEWVPDGIKNPKLYPIHVKYRLSTIPTKGQMQKPKPVLPTLLPHVNGPLPYIYYKNYPE